MTKKKKIALIVLAIILALAGIGIAGYMVLKGQSASGMEQTKDFKFITSSPIDLTQIEKLSKFRSCMGHAFYGDNALTGSEPASSMKHYVTPFKSFEGTNDKIKVFAPFDGSVDDIDALNNDMFISFRADAAPQYFFEYGHVKVLDSIKKGSKVKSGQLIGYKVFDTGASGGFDLEFGYHDNPFIKYTENLQSFLTHLTDSVADEFSTYGFTLDKMIVSKEERIANPCKTTGEMSKGDLIFTANPDVENVESNSATDDSTTQETSDKPATSSGENGSDVCSSGLPKEQLPPGCQ